ncbi:ATP-binding protein [Frisingicoccus sp.]|uniref:ATP-binding protein n=1 Tax=Frisingicoccus sp. TaxID=1918627 RepID=UPI003AB60DA3
MNKKMFFKSIRNLFILLICGILMLPAEVFAAQTDTESTVLQLSEEEQAYRDRAGEITIGCPVNNCPMLFKNEKTGEPEGIIIDVLDMVSETTGLSFHYQALPSGSITYEDLQRLNVDIVAGVESNETNEQAVGIVLTDSYLHAAKVFVCKKGTEFHPDGEMTIAVNSGSQTLERVIRKQYPQFQVLFCSSTEEALSALLSGKADAVLQNQYTIERILRKPVYENLRIVATASIGDSQCLGCFVPIGEGKQNIISDDTALLISILNKGIDNLDQGKVSFSIIRETSENAYQFTIWDMIYRYRFAMIGLFISLLFILILLWKNHLLYQKRQEQIVAQKRAKELAAINAQMKEQQLLLMDALKRAEEGNRAKTSFLFNMSHDIRTPMNAILGFTEIACHNINDSAKLKDCLEKIQSSGKLLLQLINDVLNMTEIESGKITLTEDYCNLKECIEKAPDIFQEEIEKKHLTLQTDTSTLKNEWVYCDSLHFNQILFNLLSNAVKFSKPNGNIQITLAQNSCAIREYAAYEIRVKDNGIGMSPEFLSRIFEPFEREYTSTISQTQGTGLGMSITKNLVDLMDGRIQVTSELNKGTEFILQFTFKLQEQAEPSSDETVSTIDFSGKRLLLVDDNELNMEIAEELLREAGFLVETAENGQISVEMVRNSEAGYYDAILMDIQMPVMDGYQASREIRSLENKDLAEIPIIALTANAFDEDKKEALANGMNAHIAKPLDVAILYETLEKILKNK